MSGSTIEAAPHIIGRHGLKLPNFEHEGEPTGFDVISYFRRLWELNGPDNLVLPYTNKRFERGRKHETHSLVVPAGEHSLATILGLQCRFEMIHKLPTYEESYTVDVVPAELAPLERTASIRSFNLLYDRPRHGHNITLNQEFVAEFDKDALAQAPHIIYGFMNDFIVDMSVPTSPGEHQ